MQIVHDVSDACPCCAQQDISPIARCHYMSQERSLSEFANDEHRAQAEEFLLEHGRFCIAFERVCEAMRYAILWIFQSEGLKHQGLAQVVIGDKSSAELQVILGALFTNFVRGVGTKIKAWSGPC